VQKERKEKRCVQKERKEKRCVQKERKEDALYCLLKEER
jgi:hypothetical protein